MSVVLLQCGHHSRDTLIIETTLKVISMLLKYFTSRYTQPNSIDTLKDFKKILLIERNTLNYVEKSHFTQIKMHTNG